MEGLDYRTTSSNGVLVVKEIDKKLAKNTIINNHYSNSWYHTFGVINYGIFKNEEYLGCAVFGHLKVPKSYKSICDGIEQNQIVELNRLWVDDKLGKNTETIFLSLCFKQMKKNYPHIKIIQSFADGRLGCGTIYKAQNFLYYGSHKTIFYQDPLTKRTIHEQIFHNSSRPIVITHNLNFMDRDFTKFETETYRYLYFLDRTFINKCKLKKQEYPHKEKGIKKLEYNKDISINMRYIKNTIKHLFYKQSKDWFRFEYQGKKYLYTKIMFEQGIELLDVIKKENTLFQ